MKFAKKTIDFTKANLLFLVLILQPLLDILAYIQKDMETSWAGMFRLALTVLIPLYALIFIKKRKKLILIFAVIGTFCALHVFNGFRVGYLNLVLDVKYMLLVAHAILLLFSFLFLYEKDELLRQIKASLLATIPFYAITFYISFFLKSGTHTYIDTASGWTGWHNLPNVYSILISVFFPFAVYFCIQAKKKWPILLLFPLGFVYILNGTKAAYLTLLFTLAAFLGFLFVKYFFEKKEKFPAFTCAILSVLLIFSIVYYKYSPRITIDQLNQNNVEQTENKLKDPNQNKENKIPDSPDVLTDFLDQKMVKRFGESRVLAAYGKGLTVEKLLNNRKTKIVFGSLIWDETDSITKLVGFEQARMYLDGESYDLESDFQAIYFYYGIIGAALYGLLLLYFWLRLFKQLFFHFKESFTLFNFAIFLGYGLLIFSALYTGHLLRRPNAAIYLTMVLLLVHCQTEPLFSKKSGKEIK